MSAFLLGVVVGVVAGVLATLWRQESVGQGHASLERAALEEIRRVRLDALRQMGEAARRSPVHGATPLGFSDRDIELVTRPESDVEGGLR